MNKIASLFLLTVLGFSSAWAQVNDVPIVLTLEEVIKRAQGYSLPSKQASTQLSNKYWQFRTYKSNYLPQLTLNGTLPNLNRTISSVTQNDGTDIFIRRSLSNSSLDLSLNQNVGLTGGEIFLSSQVERIDLFGDVQNNTSYLANPLLIGFRQPLFQFNQLRWDKKIEPLKYEESKRAFNEDMEDAAIEAVNLYFDLLLSQINLQIAQSSLSNSDTLYKIAEGRYNLGKIAENDLLQMQLSLMNSQTDVAQNTLDIQLGALKMRNFLGLNGKGEVKLIEPQEIPNLSVPYAKAMEQAKANRQEFLSFERQRLQAEMAVTKARKDNGVNIDLSASYGLTQSAGTFNDAYGNPLDQERVSLGLSVPILDWGRARSKIKTAEANRDLVDLTVQQSMQQFEQEIFLLSTQFDMYKRKLEIAIAADTIAQRRYDITRKRYLIGKIDILDLNVALEERIAAKRSYVKALRDFWISYFNIRKKTLYDFEKGEVIQYSTN